ncbi:hypothetical protein B0H14DRAFT_3439330 [Mycena olivaceomarginata]|nr:hypothetical protein B0H14DRAFT_3439330 [Mycena olivaceomarginata]
MYAASASMPTPPRTWPIKSRPRHAASPPIPTHRTIAGPSQIAPLVGSQGSRVPELARHGLENLKYGQGAPVLWNTGTTGVGADGDRDGGKGKKEDKKIPDARVYATWEYESKDFCVGIKKPRGQPAVQQQQPQPGRRSSRAVG